MQGNLEGTRAGVTENRVTAIVKLSELPLKSASVLPVRQAVLEKHVLDILALEGTYVGDTDPDSPRLFRQISVRRIEFSFGEPTPRS